jgi:hypothetical protein
MRYYILALVVMLAASSAIAQGSAEKFVFKKPDGFVLFNSVGSNTFYNAEYVPDGEQKGGVWKTRLMLQGIHDQKTLAPADYTTEFAAGFSKNCSQGTVETKPYTTAGAEKPASLMTCTQPAAYRIVKTIQGAETFYLVQYEFRFAPDEGQKQAARDYLNSVKLCAGVVC